MKKSSKPFIFSLALAGLTLTQSACVMVGGYSSRGGWFIWPGGFGFIIILILLYLIFRRR